MRDLTGPLSGVSPRLVDWLNALFDALFGPVPVPVPVPVRTRGDRERARR